jgi:hypothetical protein
LVPTPRKYWPSIDLQIFTKDKEISKIVLDFIKSLIYKTGPLYIKTLIFGLTTYCCDLKGALL